MINMECIILAAGFGSRARPLSYEIPKPLFPVLNKKTIDNSIEIANFLNLNPIVIIDYRVEEIISYLKRYKSLKVQKINKKSTNLYDSLLSARDLITGTHFVWMGAAMFFKDYKDISKLVKESESYFLSVIAQNKVSYKPKLKIINNRLTKFFLGDSDDFVFSAPTFIASSVELFNYIEKFSEEEAIQKAIDDGKKCNIVFSEVLSREIHTLEDYFLVNSMLSENSYISNSKINDVDLTNSFIFDSELNNSRLRNSIIINSNITDQQIENKLVWRKNEYIFRFSH